MSATVRTCAAQDSTKIRDLPPRPGWHTPSTPRRYQGTGHTARILWQVTNPTNPTKDSGRRTVNHPLGNHPLRPGSPNDAPTKPHEHTGIPGPGTAPAARSASSHPLAPQPAGHKDASPPFAAHEEKDRDHTVEPAQFPLLPPGVRQLLYTADQAAALLSVRASWLRRCAGEGTIACTFLGKHLRFSDDDLQAIITGGARGWRPDLD